jgi:hypothetical protein
VNRRITLAVSYVCQDLDISEELAFWSIKEYGDRNSTVYRDLEDHRKAEKYHSLAEILLTDLEELDMIFSEVKSPEDIAALRKMIEDEIET